MKVKTSLLRTRQPMTSKKLQLCWDPRALKGVEFVSHSLDPNCTHNRDLSVWDSHPGSAVLLCLSNKLLLDLHLLPRDLCQANTHFLGKNFHPKRTWLPQANHFYHISLPC